ncbi:mitogen-activated protein kinase [Exophiala viscosa]|uniref:Mitogen-activated protein kinase n=1 Tax=Exophiala viscosa TaxID=2486360 RepID=A0AAN6I9M9_9EURO|nr:mitogen-activated protein kinase [Exophiala viscosa]KAI1628507.1 mitogen-activated protein kinase [Exophiala viscosa]
MDTVDTDPPSNRPSLSCIRCADRKVKCDRQEPCNACIKHKAQCIYRQIPPPRKRQKRAKQEILSARIKHYEALLQEHGINPTRPAQSVGFGSRHINTDEESTPPTASKEQPPIPTPASTISESQRSLIALSETQLIQGREGSQFVDNSLWTRMVEEFHSPEDVLETASTSEATDDADGFGDEFAFVLGTTSKIDMARLHPRPPMMLELWQVFVENVDPITKVVHVPTLRPAIDRAAADIASIPKSAEALIFSIYAIAIFSLKDNDCKRKFGEPRRMLLARYISATKAALSRANFLGTNSLVVLQALMLHLMVVRDVHEPRSVWVLTGAILRIAETMGLHRDGTSLRLPPFETEIRRRIWWQLKMHDFRTAELCGIAKFRALDMEDRTCKPPLNINDDQLWPGMSTPPIASDKPTDMIFCVIRPELGSFAMAHAAKMGEDGHPVNWDKFGGADHPKLMAEFLTKIEEILETKYLRFCDPTQPLHLITVLFARTALNTGRFQAHHPRKWGSLEQIPESERQYVWDLSLKLLEQNHMAQSSPHLHQFAWHAAWFLQWHALIHVLDTLRSTPLMPDALKAWQLVGFTYENNPGMVWNTKRPIYVAVGNLCLKAYTAREVALSKSGISVPVPPPYIATLRQQREAARLRKQRQNARGSVHRTGPDYGHRNAAQQDMTATLSMTTSQADIESDDRQLARPQPPSYDIPSNAFIDSNGVYDGIFSTAPVNTDTDFMLAYDQALGDAANETVNWTQWDNWFGDVGMTQEDSWLTDFDATQANFSMDAQNVSS